MKKHEKRHWKAILALILTFDMKNFAKFAGARKMKNYLVVIVELVAFQRWRANLVKINDFVKKNCIFGSILTFLERFLQNFLQPVHLC